MRCAVSSACPTQGASIRRGDGDPLQLYNPLDDSDRLKRRPDLFEHLRGNYPLRRESVE